MNYSFWHFELRNRVYAPHAVKEVLALIPGPRWHEVRGLYSSTEVAMYRQIVLGNCRSKILRENNGLLTNVS